MDPCVILIKNKFDALSVDDEESERKDKIHIERESCQRDGSSWIFFLSDSEIPRKKVMPQKRKRAIKRQRESFGGSTNQKETRCASDPANDLECLVTSSNINMTCVDNLDTENWEQIDLFHG